MPQYGLSDITSARAFKLPIDICPWFLILQIYTWRSCKIRRHPLSKLARNSPPRWPKQDLMLYIANNIDKSKSIFRPDWQNAWPVLYNDNERDAKCTSSITFPIQNPGPAARRFAALGCSAGCLAAGVWWLGPNPWCVAMHTALKRCEEPHRGHKCHRTYIKSYWHIHMRVRY